MSDNGIPLRDLDATFIGGWHPGGQRLLEGINGAQGIRFQCPLCARGKEQGEEDGRRFYRGAHYVLCYFRNPIGAEVVPPDAVPGPGRWTAEGTGLDDLTFVPGDPPMMISVLLTGPGCGWHGFIRAGVATFE